jgi:hypothetical protein
MGPPTLAWIEFLNRLRATGVPVRRRRHFAELRRRGEATVWDVARCWKHTNKTSVSVFARSKKTWPRSP